LGDGPDLAGGGEEVPILFDGTRTVQEAEAAEPPQEGGHEGVEAGVEAVPSAVFEAEGGKEANP
jgi:hypothetical protein